MIGRTKGGLNTKLHALSDRADKPVRFFLITGQVSYCTGATALLTSLPEADFRLADRDYDADCFRYTLETRE